MKAFIGVFVPHIMTHLDTAERAYVVWDTCTTSSIKESVREKRGNSTDTTEGSWSEQAATNWPDFPHDSHELFNFLSEKIASTA